jgi:hypothetical protein
VLGIHVASIRYHTDAHTFTYDWWGCEVMKCCTKAKELCTHMADMSSKSFVCKDHKWLYKDCEMCCVTSRTWYLWEPKDKAVQCLIKNHAMKTCEKSGT